MALLLDRPVTQPAGLTVHVVDPTLRTATAAGVVAAEQAAGRRAVHVARTVAFNPWRSTADHLWHCLRRMGVPMVQRSGRAREGLAAVGLAAHAQQDPGNLPSGSLPLLPLAAAVAGRADVVVLESTLAAVGPERHQLVLDRIADLVAAGAAVVYVTDDAAEAARVTATRTA